MAHELLHVWLLENNIKLTDFETEGFCNLGAALVFQHILSKFSRILQDRLDNSRDYTYGEGYRFMKNKLKNLGWSILLESLKNL